jgi:hypothetical protein
MKNGKFQLKDVQAKDVLLFQNYFNMVHYYDWSYLMNTDENGELDRHKLIAYQGLGKW